MRLNVLSYEERLRETKRDRCLLYYDVRARVWSSLTFTIPRSPHTFPHSRFFCVCVEQSLQPCYRTFN